MVEDKKKGVKSWVKKPMQTTSETIKTVKDGYGKSELKGKVDKTYSQAKEILDRTGVPDVAGKVSKTAGEHFDTLSGAKILHLVEERLALQASYNDILATKLDEALKRIEIVESKLSKLEEL